MNRNSPNPISIIAIRIIHQNIHVMCSDLKFPEPIRPHHHLNPSPVYQLEASITRHVRDVHQRPTRQLTRTDQRVRFRVETDARPRAGVIRRTLRNRVRARPSMTASTIRVRLQILCFKPPLACETHRHPLTVQPPRARPLQAPWLPRRSPVVPRLYNVMGQGVHDDTADPAACAVSPRGDSLRDAKEVFRPFWS
jgi:hypothetical protein